MTAFWRAWSIWVISEAMTSTALEPADVWIWTRDRQPADAARAAARIASSTPSNGSLPSMRSPST